ncbi:NAD-dependent epimerase/dehydratase family protein [Paraflavitalea soli]|uniref:NAD-dependent epimerase/dehydratase family protein n=1 Tax=Paraflavitalea soli TaxID=2315862 RepID=A0A3B7MMS0_9BACT|nr:NmrA family NAD(P)-binding protein [Paraflavitalea soli]AXY74226.1 NAD-dependent epimerase/dehydratase family protein [Paraflavitalea soli]
MKIVIIGGTGLIGSQLVNILAQQQHEVIAASPNTGVNTLTGEGLEEVLKTANVVVDVSNSPSFADEPVMNFFKVSNENLMRAEKAAGVQHHIALSVVGTEKMQDGGYFRAKLVQENLIKASGIPFTIVHATQFFEFAGGIVAMSTSDDGKVRLSDALIQPIASKDVAAFLAKIATESPKNKMVEIGGPEQFRLDEWIKIYQQGTKKTLEVITDANATYSGVTLHKTTLTPENPVYLGESEYVDWISKPENQR